mgnify:FL=1
MPAQTLYGAIDEEAGDGESQPPHKSYGRIIFAGLALLAFVLIAVAAGAAGNDSHSPGNLVAYGTCTPGTEPALRCNTTYELCISKSKQIPNAMLQKKFINICMNARKSTLPKCCVN